MHFIALSIFTFLFFEICVCLSPTSNAPWNLPLLGWSTWNTFECDINSTLVIESIEALSSSPLYDAGYKWILLDDCWTKCEKYSTSGNCVKPSPRDKDGRILIDDKKFPNGFLPITALAHSRNLKIGIYTSVSAITCGGYVGSLHHEAIDAATFVSWGFDFVKHDTCGTDCPIHNGCLQNASRAMALALHESGGGKIVYYLDSGNPTSPQRLYNPHQRHITNEEALLKLAVKPSELAWVWASSVEYGPHGIKSWFDIMDTWGSTLTNAHNQVRIAEYQTCGKFNNPDMLTVGMGGQSHAEYRAQFFLWSVLGAPLIMGCDIRNMSDFVVSLVTSPEILIVDQDPDCIQGSLVRSLGATETWIKPLQDGTFAVVLLNKGDVATNCTVFLNDADQGWGAGSDFFPAEFDHMHVRDIYAKKNLGVFDDIFMWTVGARDAIIVKMTPVKEKKLNFHYQL